MIVRRMGRIWSTSLGAVALALLLLPASAVATTQEMAIQPDGKIVLIGRVWPEAGAIARLNPDGSLDSSFGEGGFVIDRRLPGFRALALQPDGRIVGAAVGGSNLTRYLPDGTPDPSFAGGGVGGTDEPQEETSFFAGYGPSAIVIRPDGSIVVATISRLGEAEAESWVRRYGSAGGPLEAIGHVPKPGPFSSARISDLLEEPDGSLIGAGSISNYGGNQLTEPLLARFVPGSGLDFDPSFGGGAGLIRPAFPGKVHQGNDFRAITADEGRLLTAGSAAGTFVVARFNQGGNLDPGFGEGGFVAPPIQGPAGEPTAVNRDFARSWAEDVAVTSSGSILAGGGTSQWATWEFTSKAPVCKGCMQPMLARFSADGHLDPNFGSGGLLRLAKPDGSLFEGKVEEVTPLPDGKVLVAGTLPSFRTSYAPFVARLNEDGSYDPSFGQGGLVTPDFPCSDQSEEQLRRLGCTPSAQVKLRLKRPHSRRPALFLQVRTNLDWAGIHALTLTLPKGLRMAPGFKARLRVGGLGKGVRVHVYGRGHARRSEVLSLYGRGASDEVRIRLLRGAFEARGRRFRQRRKLAFKVGAEFEDARWGEWAGRDTVARSVG